jgi:hypothetical protein
MFSFTWGRRGHLNRWIYQHQLYVALHVLGRHPANWVLHSRCHLLFPETHYPRSPVDLEVVADATSYPPRKTWSQSLAVFSGIHTRESLFHMFIRPIGLIMIVPILWATLVFAVTVAFLVAVSTNIAPAFEEFYGMAPWQTGLSFVAAIIGSLLAICCLIQFKQRYYIFENFMWKGHPKMVSCYGGGYMSAP